MQQVLETIHANCLRLGDKGVLLTGPSGTGKSALTLSLIERAGWSGRQACLISDDYTALRAENNKVIAACPPALVGGLEIRGAGLFQIQHQNQIALDMVVALGDDYERFPSGEQITLCGIELPLFKLPGLHSADSAAICQAIEAFCFRTRWQNSA